VANDPIFTVGDTAPALTATLNADLTNATVAFHIKRPKPYGWFTKTGTVVDGPSGKISTDWTTGDLAVPGTHTYEAEVTFSNGKIETFALVSGRDPLRFQVRQQIDDPEAAVPVPLPPTYGDRLGTVETGLAAEVTRATAAEATKVNSSTYTAGIAAAVQRANHTGTQTASTISDFAAAVAAIVDPQAPAPGVIKAANTRTIVTAFQAGHGWTIGGSPATYNLNDTSDAGLGTQSVTWTCATATAAYVESPTLGTPINLTGKTFSVLVKIPSALLDNMSYAYVFAGSGGSFANYNNFRIRLRSAQQNNQSAFTSGDEWVWLTCPRSQMAVGAGTVDLTAINKIRVICSPLAAAQTSIKVGAVAIVDQPTAKFPNGAVSLTFDDGYSSVSAIAKLYMDKYAMRGTVFPITEVIDGVGKVTSTDLLAMQRNGWEIALHTATLQAHSDGFYAASDATIRGELNTASATLAGFGLGRPNGFAWPRGQLNGTAIKSTRRVTRYGRNNDFASGAETLPPADPWRIRSWPIAATDALATLTALVDAAKTGQSWQVFTIHDILASGATGGQQMNQTVFNGLIDYLATAGVPVLPMGDVADSL
jgi:peptidoglycan/xylan/chitin deacetylase (PgdA/CDA1 family)